MVKTLTAILGKTHEGTTERLIQLSGGYFLLYVLTGYLAKYFDKVLGVSDVQYTFYNTIGGMLICNAVVLIWGWYKFKSSDTVRFMGFNMPREFFYIIPSGICTAIVIPTTTLMYTLPISVMVAMIIMRASIIIISRLIDEVQIRQGILKKKVYWEENLAVVIALAAVSLQLLNFKGAFLAAGQSGCYSNFVADLFKFDKKDFDFLGNAAAMTILTFYLTAYTIRIYIMNYYKNTRPKGAVYDTNGFFAIEQISSTIAITLAGVIFFFWVNRPASIAYSPVEVPAVAAVNIVEAEKLQKTLSSAQQLLAEETGKFDENSRAFLEEKIKAGAAVLSDKKAKKEDFEAIAKDIEEGIKPVKRSFAYKFSEAVKKPTEKWFVSILSGLPFGAAAFFSVFLFMFKGRTATFAGLVNRLTSLIAGTAATVLVYLLIKGQKMPKEQDWLGLVLMFVAIYFIGRAEKKRACELAREKEIVPESGSEITKNCETK